MQEVIYLRSYMSLEVTISEFFKYFTEIYGEARWAPLYSRLCQVDEKVARLNPYLKVEYQNQEITQFFSQQYMKEVSARGLLKDKLNQNQFYFLDLASMLPPLALAPLPSEVCLDMCAAPGGKSLILASLMAPNEEAEIELVANELSQERRSRLIRVLKEQLPDKLFRQIKITAHDASKWCLYQKDHYDKILIDVPCSGERYFILDAKEVLNWSKKRSQNMAIRQFSILASAFESLKIGGAAVYSTCSISPFENDEVIKKLLKKRSGRVELSKLSFPIGETTEFGWQVLPDQCSGFGPIYFSKFNRLS